MQSEKCVMSRRHVEKAEIKDSFQPGLIKIRTSVHFVRNRFTYLTARFTSVSKRNVHRVVLKHRLNM